MDKKKINPFLKFGIWMVVIIVMGIVAFVKDNNENHWTDEFKQTKEEQTTEENKKDNTITYSMMKDVLVGNNYDFVFTIKNDNKYTYTGRRCNGLEEGFKENKDGVIKYIIDTDSKSYKIINDEYIEISDLFDGFDNSFLDVKLLFDNLNTVLYNQKTVDNETIYSYIKDGYQVEVTTNDKDIKKIIITNEDTTYILEFANIGKCAKIDFNN